MSERWHVNPETPNTIMTPDGRITVAWKEFPAENPYRLAEERAAQIVREHNAHDALVAACEAVVASVDRAGLTSAQTRVTIGIEVLNSIRAALALAKPQPKE